MNYRFQKITTFYDTTQPGLSSADGKGLSYQQLYERFVGQHLGWSDYFAKKLEGLGHRAEEIFANCEQLQKVWATEHGVKFTRRGWFREIVVAQVKAFQPDVLFLEDLYVFDYDFRQLLRAECSRPVTIIGWRGGPTTDFAAFKDIDVLLTCSPGFVDQMRQHGLREVHLMYPGFEPALIDLAASATGRDLPFTFVGSLVIGSGFHNQRYEIIEHLMQSTPLEVWGQISEWSGENGSAGPIARLKSRTNQVLARAGVPPHWRQKLTTNGELIDRRPESLPSIVRRYPERVHEPVFGLDNFRILGRSRIAFNKHIDCAEDYAGNVRLFEATGMGACLLTDWKINMAELFEPDVEVVVYKSRDECVEKVKYLLDHETECVAIGRAGQARALRDHTFTQRAAQLDEIIQHVIALQRVGCAAKSPA